MIEIWFVRLRLKGVAYPMRANKENPRNYLCFNRKKKVKKYCRKFEKLFAI